LGFAKNKKLGGIYNIELEKTGLLSYLAKEINSPDHKSHIK
jgi:hypothetical protein